MKFLRFALFGLLSFCLGAFMTCGGDVKAVRDLTKEATRLDRNIQILRARRIIRESAEILSQEINREEEQAKAEPPVPTT